jgi:beta-1,4-mannosyl-glycoprotein beta-1,4-N-acetylglucosaminyltransferase
VDYFVIFESNSTFSKKNKGFLLDEKRFEKFKTKIIYIKNQDWIRSQSPWSFETYQRNKIADGIIGAQNTDMIILSDLDEIPKKQSVIKAFCEIYKNNNKYVRLELSNFRYALNNISANNTKSTSVIITKKENTISMQELRIKQKANITILNAGWHYSFVSSIENIIFKISSYSHQEYNRWPNNDLESIKKRIYNGQSNFGHEEDTYNRIKLNENNCPKYVLKNKDKYARLIFTYEQSNIWSKIMSLYNTKICSFKKYTMGIRDKSSKKINTI